MTFLDDGATTDPRFAGFLGGGEIGYNYQVGKWVFGLEGDLAWTNAHGARPCPIGFFANCEINMNWLSTATGSDRVRLLGPAFDLREGRSGDRARSR